MKNKKKFLSLLSSVVLLNSGIKGTKGCFLYLGAVCLGIVMVVKIYDAGNNWAENKNKDAKKDLKKAITAGISCAAIIALKKALERY